MSEFIAEAVVNVRADTKKFITEFNAVVNQARKTKVDILVRPDFKGFRTDLRTKLDSSKRGINIDIPVRPDMTGFRTRLQEAVARSSRGVFADVTVRAGAVTQGAAAATTGGGGGAAGRSATAEQAALAAIQAGVFARQQVTGLIDEQDRRLARIERQDAAILAAQKAQTLAIREQNGELQRSAILVEQRARAEREVTAGALAKEEGRRIARDPNVRAAAAKAELTAEQKLAHARLREREEFFDADSRAKLDAAESRRASLQRFVAQEVAIERKALDQQLADRAAFQTRLTKLQTPIQDISKESLAALGSEGGNEGRIRKQITVLTHANVEAQNQLTAAKKAGFAVEAQTAEALVKSTGELKLNAEAALLATVHNTKLSHTLDNVRRAAVAQAAALTGLRGAALTAASAFIATSAAIIAVNKAVNLAADLESELSVFQVTAEATAHTMEEVHERAIELGRDITLPGVSAGDAAIALTELAKAGLSAEDAMDGARGVLQLATAANISFEQATLLAANALNSFGLAGEEAGHVADVLANAANESQGSIVDMGVALQQSSAVIRQAGISLEEGVAALTLFASAGLRGSDAGTSLRTALIRLINPSDKAKEVINDLGLQIRDATGAIDLGVFQQFQDVTREMTTAQRDQALAIIFGQDAIRGAAILAREGAAGLSEMEVAVNKTGTAAKVAAARTSGYKGAIENLKNTIESLGEAIGAELLGPLTLAVNLITDSIRAVEELVGGINKLRGAIAKPIDIVIRTITGQGEGEDPEGFVQRFGEIATKALTGDFKGAVQAAAKDFTDLRKKIQQEGKDLNAAIAFGKTPEIFKELREAADSPSGLNKLVLKLKEMQKSMEGGSEKTQGLRDRFAGLVKEIQELSNQPEIEIPVTLEEDFLSGRIGQEAGKLTAESFSRSFTGVLEQFPSLSGKAAAEKFRKDLVDTFGPAAAAAAAEIAATLRNTLAQEGGQELGFDRAAVQARIANDVPAEIAALQGKASRIRAQIAKINKATLGAPTDAALAKRSELESRLDQTLDAITSLEKGEVSKRKQKAQEAQTASNEADQALLDALAPAKRRLDTRALLAEGTARLQDDIAVARAQIANNQKQIAVINKSFRDRQKAGELIADLRDENIKLNQQIAGDLAAAFDVKLEAAQASGNIDKAINLTTQRINKLNRLIREGRKEGEAIQQYIDERIERRRQLEELTDERLAARTEFAQSVFDLTGNKNPLIAAINAEIRDAIESRKRAKRGSVLWLKAQTEINKLRLQKKNLIKQVEADAKRGPSAFDLLTMSVQTFNANAGNLINANQPFAGPTGFTADIAQFLRRTQGVGAAPSLTPERPTAKTQFEINDDRIVRSLDRLADVIEGKTGSNDTVGITGVAAPFSKSLYVDVLGQRGNAMARFWEARSQRKQTNAESGG